MFNRNCRKADISGRVHLDRAEPAGFPGVYLGTIDRRSDPDWLADEISAEASSRDKHVQHRVTNHTARKSR